MVFKLFFFFILQWLALDKESCKLAVETTQNQVTFSIIAVKFTQEALEVTVRCFQRWNLSWYMNMNLMLDYFGSLIINYF